MSCKWIVCYTIFKEKVREGRDLKATYTITGSFEPSAAVSGAMMFNFKQSLRKKIMSTGTSSRV